MKENTRKRKLVVVAILAGLAPDGTNLTANVLANFAMGGNVSILQGVFDLLL